MKGLSIKLEVVAAGNWGGSFLLFKPICDSASFFFIFFMFLCGAHCVADMHEMLLTENWTRNPKMFADSVYSTHTSVLKRLAETKGGIKERHARRDFGVCGNLPLSHVGPTGGVRKKALRQHYNRLGKFVGAECHFKFWQRTIVKAR